MIDNIKVVLFDLDGTIIDTEPFHYKCWNNILNSYGFEISYEQYLATYAGIAIDNNCRLLIARYQLKASMADLRYQKERSMIKFLLCNKLEPMEYVRETITHLQQLNIQLGLVTSSSSEETKIILKSLMLEDVFANIITRDDVINKKPNPEPYLLAKTFFGFNDNNYLVFEDSMSGIESAKKAGLKCFAIRNDAEDGSIYHVAADGVFKNFTTLATMLFIPEAHQE